MRKIKLIPGPLFLLFCSVANASLIYGLGGSDSTLFSLDIDSGISAAVFGLPLERTPFNTNSGLAFVPLSPVPVPAAIWLSGTAIIGMFGFIRRKLAAL
jgi:hypothetical protein